MHILVSLACFNKIWIILLTCVIRTCIISEIVAGNMIINRELQVLET